MNGRVTHLLRHGPLIGLLTLSLSTFAADWPQWLGPRGDNIADNDAFAPDLTEWKVLWKANVGLGCSSVAVAVGRAIVLGHDGKSQETVYCFDAASGLLQWKYSYNAPWLSGAGPGGPRASASIVGDKVVTVSRDGQIFCFSTTDGTVLWTTNLPGLFSLSLPAWGVTSSPMTENGQVMFSAGQLASLDLFTGRLLWASDPASPPAYTTPVIFTRGGKDFVAVIDGAGLAIRAAQGGALVARVPFQQTFDVTATAPLVFDNGDHILVSGNAHTELFAFNGTELGPLWDNRSVHNLLNDSVVMGGVIYGISSLTNASGTQMTSLNAADGSVNWTNDKFGYGTLVGVGNRLLALTMGGEAVTIKPTSAGYSEVSRLQVIGPECFSTATYAEGQIYLRNDKGDVVCLGR
jgi:outer membrane protein assembly factor BamB